MDHSGETIDEFELDEGTASFIVRDRGSVTQALPPTDAGKDAYTVLAGCFLIEVFTWGT